jgi:hypothetical protein
LSPDPTNNTAGSSARNAGAGLEHDALRRKDALPVSHPTALDLAGYARCSDSKQERSVPEQVEWLNALAERDGHTRARIFSDEAIPGRDLTREGFQEMLARCEARYKGAAPRGPTHLKRVSRHRPFALML